MIRACSPPRSPFIAVIVAIAAIVVMMAFTSGLAADHQSLPPGTYATTIALDDVPDSFNAPKADLVGQWQVDFTEAGSAIVHRDGRFMAEGPYSSSPGFLEVTSDSGPYACGTTVGRYGWTLEDGELSLTLEDDGCPGRAISLTARPLIALGSTSSGSLVTAWLSDDDPGLPYYARIESTAPYVLHDGAFAAIVFYRGPVGIPEDFNLLTFFDLPTGPEHPGAFAVPLNVAGTYLWNEEVWVDAPRIINSHGLGAVPVWFVPVVPLLALIDANDQVLTLADLRGIAGLRVGEATEFHEALHPSPSPPDMGGGGGHPRPSLRILAQGTLEDGAQFTLNLSKGPAGASIRFFR